MVDRMGDRLAHVHLADGNGSSKDEHLVPGRGDQPCAELLERLALTGFDGHVVIEVNTRRAMSAAEREADLAEALAFTRLHLASATAQVAARMTADGRQRPARPRRPPKRRGRPARTAGATGPAPATASWTRPAPSSPSAATTRRRSAASPRRPGSTPRWCTTTSAPRSRSSRRRSRSAFEPALARPGRRSRAARDGVGERLARYFFGVWENPATRAPLLAIIRSALTHETAAAVLRGFVAAAAAGPDRGGSWTCRTRSSARSWPPRSMIGIAMLRYVIKVEPLASADPEKIVALVAPTLQRYLTRGLTRRPGVTGRSA